MAAIKTLVRVNEGRQYLCGHSMGGYGAWHIAHRSANAWAALGIHAGALSYNMGEVDGTSDGLLDVNQIAYALLQNAGDPNLAFVTFPGGHDYRQSDVEGPGAAVSGAPRDARRRRGRRRVDSLPSPAGPRRRALRRRAHGADEARVHP